MANKLAEWDLDDRAVRTTVYALRMYPEMLGEVNRAVSWGPGSAVVCLHVACPRRSPLLVWPYPD